MAAEEVLPDEESLHDEERRERNILVLQRALRRYIAVRRARLNQVEASAASVIQAAFRRRIARRNEGMTATAMTTVTLSIGNERVAAGATTGVQTKAPAPSATRNAEMEDDSNSFDVDDDEEQENDDANVAVAEDVMEETSGEAEEAGLKEEEEEGTADDEAKESGSNEENKTITAVIAGRAKEAAVSETISEAPQKIILASSDTIKNRTRVSATINNIESTSSVSPAPQMSKKRKRLDGKKKQKADEKVGELHGKDVGSRPDATVREAKRLKKDDSWDLLLKSAGVVEFFQQVQRPRARRTLGKVIVDAKMNPKGKAFNLCWPDALFTCLVDIEPTIIEKVILKEFRNKIMPAGWEKDPDSSSKFGDGKRAIEELGFALLDMNYTGRYIDRCFFPTLNRLVK